MQHGDTNKLYRIFFGLLLAGLVLFIGMDGQAQDRAFTRTSQDLQVDGLIDSPDGESFVQTHTFNAHRRPLEKSSPAQKGKRSGARGPAPFDPYISEFLFTGDLPEGDTPSAAAFTTDGSKFMIAHLDSMNLIVYDAATRTFLQEIALSGSPVDLAVSNDGIHAVTANMWEDTASIVDLTTGQEIAVVAIGDQPGAVRITPDGLTAVVGNTVDSTLSVIDIATAIELHRMTDAGFVGSASMNFEPGAISFSFSKFVIADNTTLVHPDYYNSLVQIYHIPSGAKTTLGTDAYPRGIAVTPDGTKAVVAHTSSTRRLTVIDVAAASIAKTITTPVDLWGPVTIRPDGSKAVVSVQNACRVVNLTTNAITSDINTASVYDLLTTADGLYAMGVGYRGSLISYATETLVKDLNNYVSTPVGAVSPTNPRAVLAANTFGEDMVVVNTSGTTGYMEGHAPSGPPPEADKSRTVAVSSDGSKAVVVNIFSDNASILNLKKHSPGQLEAIVDLGDRPAEVAITPDSSQAVVANLDSSFVSVIDLGSHAVTNINLSSRQSQVEISPDGKYAYVAVLAYGDGVWRVDLDTLTVAGPKLITGNMGSIGYLYQQTSGMTLSHDGATLVTCDSFDNTLSVIDTATWTVLTAVAVGDFPVRAIFSENDAMIYVSHRNNDTLGLVRNLGSSSAMVKTINVGDYPYEMVLDPNLDRLYVLNFYDKNVGVVDLGASSMVHTLALPNSPGGLAISTDGSYLFVPTGTWSLSLGPGPKVSFTKTGEMSVINSLAASISYQVNTGLPPAMLAFNGSQWLSAFPSPQGDGLLLFWQIFFPKKFF